MEKIWIVQHQFGTDGALVLHRERENALNTVREIVRDNYDDGLNEDELSDELAKVDALTAENNVIDMGDCSVTLSEIEVMP